jgi:hypothetical protein
LSLLIPQSLATFHLWNLGGLAIYSKCRLRRELCAAMRALTQHADKKLEIEHSDPDHGLIAVFSN